METPTRAQSEMWYGAPVNWALAVGVIVLPFLAWLDSLSFGFVGDDLTHLISDVHLPPWKGSDNLFRPLRNILLRDVLVPIFGVTPQAYHVMLLVLYYLTVLSVWWMAREFLGRRRALIVTVVFALFPRNYSSIFWVASCQDLIVIPLIITAVVFWLRQRDAIAIVCYLVALGFKETAIICPALFLLADVTLEKASLQPRRYIPLAISMVGYGVYIALSGSRNVTKTDGIYGFGSVIGASLAELREVANIVLPFHRAFGLRDMALADWLLVGIVLCAFGFLAVKCRQRRLALFGLGWALIALAPTSIFARTVNSDHYLMLPLVGIVIFIGAVIERHEILAASAAIVFAIAGYGQLIEYRQVWRTDSERVAGLEREIRAKIHAPLKRITFINLTHAGISNAVGGLVIEAGIPASVPVRQNFASPDGKQESFMKLLSACHPIDFLDRTFIYDSGALIDISGPCATAVVDDDVRTRPYAWL
jgi:hypothetical protein